MRQIQQKTCQKYMHVSIRIFKNPNLIEGCQWFSVTIKFKVLAAIYRTFNLS